MFGIGKPGTWLVIILFFVGVATANIVIGQAICGLLFLGGVVGMIALVKQKKEEIEARDRARRNPRRGMW